MVIFRSGISLLIIMVLLIAGGWTHMPYGKCPGWRTGMPSRP